MTYTWLYRTVAYFLCSVTAVNGCDGRECQRVQCDPPE